MSIQSANGARFQRRSSPSIAVVGGGFGGVGALAMLRRAGYRDVTAFERGERVGGVWHDNTYPGAACDVASHLYEFSFEPNPRWSRRYAPQAEIQAYLEDVARRHGALDRIRTNTEVTRALWDGERGRWVLETSAGVHEAELRLHAARCGRNDQAPLDPRGVPRRRPPSDRQGDRGSRAPSQGDAERRDRLQAADAHRRVVSDAHQAERGARHRPDRRGHASR